MNNAIHWFEIFVSDMDRAARFYETALGIKLHREVFNGTQHAIFAADKTGVAGALVYDPKQPAGGSGGTIVYLNAQGKLDETLARTPQAGGTVLLAKTDIGDPGFIAKLRDTEGNVIGLHAERS
jgi:predicted enzyme related to lactoylglutathione lyase